jgi:uncharacterized protein YndB with AHSA1/START domain
VQIMADIVHQFPINAAASKVFDAIATPAGLDSWWTLRCSGEARHDGGYELYFGYGYDWRAVASRFVTDREFELTFTVADDDWRNTRVNFALEEKGDHTEIRFQHSGWPQANEHYNISCYCWAMYLRLLKRYVEFGEIIPYEKRLEA